MVEWLVNKKLERIWKCSGHNQSTIPVSVWGRDWGHPELWHRVVLFYHIWIPMFQRNSLLPSSGWKWMGRGHDHAIQAKGGKGIRPVLADRNGEQKSERLWEPPMETSHNYHSAGPHQTGMLKNSPCRVRAEKTTCHLVAQHMNTCYYK
jgi:hypothetical protein